MRRGAANSIRSPAARRRRLQAQVRDGNPGVSRWQAWLWPLLLFSLATGFLLYSRLLPVPGVQIEGQLHMLSRQQLLQSLQPHLQRGFLGLDLQQVRQTLVRMPWVRSAHVQRTWPPGILLRLEEQRPYARWGEEHYINEQGNIFPATSREAGLPALNGPEGREREVLSRYRELSPLLAGAGLSLRELWLDGPCCWRMRLECGGEIVAGLPGSADDVQRFVAVYRRLAEESGSVLARADLRYPNGLAIAWHGTSPGDCRRQTPGNGGMP